MFKPYVGILKKIEIEAVGKIPVPPYPYDKPEQEVHLGKITLGNSTAEGIFYYVTCNRYMDISWSKCLADDLIIGKNYRLVPINLEEHIDWGKKVPERARFIAKRYRIERIEKSCNVK